MNALEVEGLGHAFGPRAALKDVSFAVAPGEFAVLLGLNGAGKTTLVSLVTRLYHARVGEIRVFGHALRTEPSRALAAIGIVFQAADPRSRPDGRREPPLPRGAARPLVA